MFPSRQRGLIAGRSKWLRTPRRRANRRGIALRPGLEGLEGRTVLSFLPPVSYATGPDPKGIAVADFNSDSHADLAVVDYGAPGVSILLGNGDGTFQPRSDVPVALNEHAIAVGDFNGDGRPDLAVIGADTSSQFAESRAQSVVWVLLNNGGGSFGAPASYSVPAADSLAVADFNGDGHADIAAVGVGGVSLLLGNGTGSFQAAVTMAAPNQADGVVEGDFNGDGRADLAVAQDAISTAAVSIYLGRGDGTFLPAQSFIAGAGQVDIATGDFNLDGKPDIVVADSFLPQGTVSVLMGNGDGTFATALDVKLPDAPLAVRVADFNGDGIPDLVESGVPFSNPPPLVPVTGGASGGSTSTTSTGATDALMVELGHGDGTFANATTDPATSGDVANLAVGDFNGDLSPDVAETTAAFSTDPATVEVAINANGAGGPTAGAVGFRVTTPGDAELGAAYTFTATAVDASGNPVSGFRGTVQLTTSDPAASVATTTYTFTAADAGTHVFSNALTFHTAGSQTITLTSPNLGATAVTVKVDSVQTSRLTLSAPAASTAGAPVTFTLTAWDNFGNIATGYTGTVRIDSTDPTAAIPSTITFTAADAGVKTFTGTFKTAANDQITATDTVNPALEAQVYLAVSPAAASTFVVSGGAGMSGIVRPLTITAMDPFGNVVTGYGGTVALTSSDPAAVLGGGGTLTGGTGTFNVILNTPGLQSITATDTANPALSGTETGILVTPAGASGLVVQGAASTTAGVAQSFTVTAVGADGSTVTNYNGTIVFSSSDIQAGLPASYTFTAADAGVHTFSIVLKTAGLQTVTAHDTLIAAIGSQSGIAVTPAAAASFTVAGFPGTTAGVAQTFTVTARDAFGNVATGYTGTASFRSSDTQAGLPAGYTFTVGDAGVHTFAAVLKTAGSQSITATDAATPTITGAESGIIITAGAVTHLGISGPTSATAGVSFTVKVSALDAYGNVVTGYRGKVHFSDSATNAGLPSDYTFSGGDNGVHSFSVTLNTVALQTLTVVDTTNNMIMGSLSINVTPKSSGGGGTGGGGTGGGGTGGGGSGSGGSGSGGNT